MGMQHTRDVLGEKVLRELGKYCTDVVRVPRSQLVVEAGDELVVDGLRHLLHLFTYLYTFRLARLTKGVEGRLGPQGPPVAAGLARDAGAVAVGGHGDGNVVQAEGSEFRAHFWARSSPFLNAFFEFSIHKKWLQTAVAVELAIFHNLSLFCAANVTA